MAENVRVILATKIFRIVRVIQDIPATTAPPYFRLSIMSLSNMTSHQHLVKARSTLETKTLAEVETLLVATQLEMDLLYMSVVFPTMQLKKI